MISIFDIFKIGIGPSSSHTMGPMLVCNKIIDRINKHELLDEVKSIKIELFGSLAYTGKAHGTDKALVAGLSGFKSESVNPKDIKSVYQKVVDGKTLNLSDSLSIKFDIDKDIIYDTQTRPPYHSNALTVHVYGNNQHLILKKTYYSIGGGAIVSDNKIDSKPIYVKFPYRYTSASELFKICDKNKMNIWHVILENEKSFRDEADINSKIRNLWSVMNSSIETGIATKGILDGGLKVERRAPDLFNQLINDKSNDSLLELDYVNVFAIAVNEENSSGGRVVTAPTNGASGVIPAVIKYAFKFIDKFDDESLIRFFLTAGAVGGLYKLNASISGAEVGCQGEVGVACSMAAAGLVAALNGSNNQIENAAEIAMEHNLGLTCDPINGLVQIPCIERNAMGAVKSINAARLALKTNKKNKVSLDQVIKTMYDTGRDMQSNYKETSKGGLAVNVVEC